MATKNEIAKQNVRRALDIIAEAQDDIAAACKELSPIVGASDEYDLVCDHYDATKELWHKINAINLDKIKIDEMRAS